jgi:hypothetical protein
VVEVELEVGTEVGWELGLIPYNGSPVFLGRLGADINKIKSLKGNNIIQIKGTQE